MAIIRAYTTIEQSRKLADILPIESADMHYCLENRGVATGYEIGTNPFIKAKRFEGKCNVFDVQPAWSLASLLAVLPKYELYNFGDTIQLDVNLEALATEGDETLIDLVVNMIIHLHELKML